MDSAREQTWNPVQKHTPVQFQGVPCRAAWTWINPIHLIWIWIWTGFGFDFDFVLGLDWILDSKYFMDLDMDLDSKVPWIWIWTWIQ